MRNRYDNPVLQRFISPDPIGFRGGDANLYAYTQNSPTNFTDPLGLWGGGGGSGDGGGGGSSDPYDPGAPISAYMFQVGSPCDGPCGTTTTIVQATGPLVGPLGVGLESIGAQIRPQSQPTAIPLVPGPVPYGPDSMPIYPLPYDWTPKKWTFPKKPDKMPSGPYGKPPADPASLDWGIDSSPEFWL